MTEVLVALAAPIVLLFILLMITERILEAAVTVVDFVRRLL